MKRTESDGAIVIGGDDWRGWMGRWALWGVRRESCHLATRAATVGRGVVYTLACGGGTALGLGPSTWYCRKITEKRRMCRRCTAILARAGDKGSILAARRANGRIKGGQP